MLYLIECGDYYKIGYASDIDRRLKQYNTHNPDYIVIDTKEGDTKDEALLHRRCKEFRIKGEWFEKCADVLDAWYTYEKVIDEYTFVGFDELDIGLRDRLLVLLRSSHNNYVSYSDTLEDLIESGFIRMTLGGLLLNPYLLWKGDLRDRMKVLLEWEI